MPSATDLPDALSPASRQRLFWMVCLSVRSLWAVSVLVWGHEPMVALWMAVLCLSVSVTLFGNTLRTLAGLKTHGGFGGVVWWGRARVLHATLWAGAGATLLSTNASHLVSGGLLLADVVFAALFGGLYYGRGIAV